MEAFLGQPKKTCSGKQTDEAYRKAGGLKKQVLIVVDVLALNDHCAFMKKEKHMQQTD